MSKIKYANSFQNYQGKRRDHDHIYERAIYLPGFATILTAIFFTSLALAFATYTPR